MGVTLKDNDTGKEMQFETLSQLHRQLELSKPVSSFFSNLDLVQKLLEMEGKTKTVRCPHCDHTWTESFGD